jgi:GTP-binding protein
MARLRRIYILFNAKHSITRVDEAMLKYLNKQCKDTLSLQPVITKADTIPLGSTVTVVDKMRDQIRKAAPTCLPAILTSAYMSPPFGIAEVRKSIIEACGIV